jgi:ribosome recycling factor
MFEGDAFLSGLDTKMKNSVSALTREFLGIRTNRASAALLDSVKIEAYGSFVPITQVATVSVPEARLLVVQVWDKSTVKFVEKAIRDSDLGLNPVIEGQIVRVPMPPLSEERRHELTKVASRHAEDAKISIRNARREALESLKKQEKAKDITEDDLHAISDTIQKLTDSRIKEVEEMLAKKQKDIMSL